MPSPSTHRRSPALALLLATSLLLALAPGALPASATGSVEEADAMTQDAVSAPPDWAWESRVYHTFPDRFRDGDRTNNVDVDPTQSMDDALRDWMGGDLAGIRQGLDHIRGAGFNTIWLGPVFDNAFFHGYHPIDYLDVDENFGTLEELRALVQDVHARGMRIVYDMVPNHTSNQHAWFQDVLALCEDSDFFTWYTFSVCDPETQTYEYEAFFGLDELPQLNLEDPEARAYMTDIVVPFYLSDGPVHIGGGQIVQGLDFDGFRLDYVLGPSMDFWAAFADAVDEADDDAFIFGEATVGRQEIAEYAEVFDGALNFPSHHALKDTIARGDRLTGLDAAIRADQAVYPEDFVVLSFLDNHDEARFRWVAGQAETPDLALARLEAAFVTQFALPDVPVVYQGTEVGMGQTSDTEHPEGGWVDRWYREPIPWPDLGLDAWEHDWWADEDTHQEWNTDILELVQDLNAARAASPALLHGDYETVAVSRNVLAFEREHDGDRVLAILHTGQQGAALSLADLYGAPIPDGVILTDLLDGRVRSSGQGDLRVPFEAVQGAIFAVAGPLPSPPAVSATRLSGAGRIETAIAISQEHFLDGEANTVVLARADMAPDALAGIPLAVDEDAPMLVTPTDELTDAVADEIDRVLGDDGTVVLLGGTAALQEGIEGAVADLGFEPERVYGSTRVETSLAIAERLDDPEHLLVTTGADFPDALAAGPAASNAGGAVLLTTPEVAHPAVTAYLEDREEDSTTWAVGGPAARAFPDEDAIVGRNRVETAVAVAEEFFGDDPPVVGIARQDTFPDALTGGAHVGAMGGAMLLTSTTSLPGATATFLCGVAETVSQLFVYGGTSAVSAATVAAIDAHLAGEGC